jgi:rhodanese-related sulfurtransferase
MTYLRNAFFILLIAMVSAALYNAYSGRGIPWFPQVNTQAAGPKLVLSTTVSINYLDLSEAQEKFDQNVRFIDSRDAEQYQGGRVQGALLLPYGASDSEIETALAGHARDAELVVYCDGEECGASTTLAGKLQKLGYSRVSVFFGGWEEWVSAGLPTEKGLQ